MAYPLDQLTALIKANLDLSFGLAEIARKGNFQAAIEAWTAFAEAVQSAPSPSDKTTTLSDRGISFFNEVNKIREQMIADTRAACEQWQDEWNAAVALPDNVKMFAGLRRSWQEIGTATHPSDDNK